MGTTGGSYRCWPCPMLAAALLLAVVGGASAKTPCEATPRCSDRALVGSVRADIEAACPCAAASSARDHRRCWKPRLREARRTLGKTGLPSACRKEVGRAFANSLCGRTDRVLCSTTNRKGRTTCRVTKAQRCAEQPGRRTVCVGFESCADACNPAGGCATTTSTTSTSSTSITTSSTTTITSSTTSTSTTLASGCFTDFGDGTIVDGCTELEWEKKTASDGLPDAANPHDADNVYSWAGDCVGMGLPCQPNAEAAAACAAATNGDDRCLLCAGTCDVDPFTHGAITTIWDWIGQVNVSGLGGHGDWRVPRVERGGHPAELESIVDLLAGECGGGFGPCIDPIFGPTGATYYWSGTPDESGPFQSWAGRFDTGALQSNLNSVGFRVRAVRFLVPPPTTTSSSTSSSTTTTTSTSTSSTTSTTLSPCLTDLGDGTVLDACTGLQWERKDADDGIPDAANPLDVDNVYTWAGRCNAQPFCQPNTAAAAACFAQTGLVALCSECGPGTGTCNTDSIGNGALTTIWDRLAQWNASAHLGHDDWRVPTVATDDFGQPTGDPAELESIVDCRFTPCIDPTFGPTVSAGTFGDYVTASGRIEFDKIPTVIRFTTGTPAGVTVFAGASVRFVRGGTSTTTTTSTSSTTVTTSSTTTTTSTSTSSSSTTTTLVPSTSTTVTTTSTTVTTTTVP